MSSKKLYIVDWEEADSSPRRKVIYSLDISVLDRLEPLAEDDPILSPLLPMIDRNVALAAVPENFCEGCACYLLNLNSLKEEP